MHLVTGRMYLAPERIYSAPRLFIFAFCLLSCITLHSCTRMVVFCDRMGTYCTWMVIFCTQMNIHIHCPSSIIVLCFYIVSVYLYSLISGHPFAPSLLCHFIPICVFCECLSLAAASSIVSVSYLIQALSSVLYIDFMVQQYNCVLCLILLQFLCTTYQGQ